MTPLGMPIMGTARYRTSNREIAMQAARRRLLAASTVLVAGTAAAIPFYHAERPDIPAKSVAIANSKPREMVPLQIAGETTEQNHLSQRPGVDAAKRADSSPKPQSSSRAPMSVPQLPNMLPTIEKQVPPASAIIRTHPASPSNATSVAPTEVRQRLHRIADGDSLELLARRFLGDASRWPEIRDANRDILIADDILPIGKELRIPPRGAATTVAAEQSQTAAAGLVPIPSAQPNGTDVTNGTYGSNEPTKTAR